METGWRDNKNQAVGNIALFESKCAHHIFVSDVVLMDLKSTCLNAEHPGGPIKARCALATGGKTI